jgi:deoxyribose-phosphate aldolase
VAYLKNSSGFDGGTATPDLVAELVRLAAGRLKVKASGGIRTLEDAASLLESGADLLGTSAGTTIIARDPQDS